MEDAPNSLNLNIKKLGLENLNETLKLTLEDDPQNTRTSGGLKEGINEETKQLQKNSPAKSLQNDLACQVIEEEYIIPIMVKI